jgi:hypothetical protein
MKGNIKTMDKLSLSENELKAIEAILATGP